MHPRTAELAELLDRTRADLRAAVAAVPLDAGQRRPPSGVWSPAEIVAHLAIVEGKVGRLLARLLDQAGPLPPRGDALSALTSLDQYRLLDRSIRVPGPESVQPSPTANLTVAMAELEQARRGLQALLARADGLDTERISAPHPLLGPLKFEQWMVFLAQHEARHTAQLREVVAVVT
jgi:hypothetical protein